MNKYFTTFAEAEVQQLPYFHSEITTLRLQFSQAVCIPFFDENLQLLTSLSKAAEHYEESETQLPRLLILCINRAENSQACEQNNRAIDNIQQLECQWKIDNLSLYSYSQHLSILLINRSENLLIPIKQGVGLARKIACDIAAFLIEKKLINNSVFMSSDADVIFPKDYFSSIHKMAQNLQSQHSAFVLSYQHIAPIHLNHGNQESNKLSQQTAINQATDYYERSLRAYEAGLRSAGSPYAYQTIGSCIAIEANAYIQVRGFPKRSAGEDFYLLNKLNKLKPVKSLQEPTLSIQARISQRVPFGTGPAVEKILDGNSAIFYDPMCFELLKEWIDFLVHIASIENIKDLNKSLEQSTLNSSQFSKRLLFDLFITLNTEKFAIQCLKQHRTVEKRIKAYHDWFDGFKTLKAIHLFATDYPKFSNEF